MTNREGAENTEVIFILSAILSLWVLNKTDNNKEMILFTGFTSSLTYAGYRRSLIPGIFHLCRCKGYEEIGSLSMSLCCVPVQPFSHTVYFMRQQGVRSKESLLYTNSLGWCAAEATIIKDLLLQCEQDELLQQQQKRSHL